MKTYSRPRRSERTLLQDAATHHAQETEGRNKLVADIAEIDARKAHRRAGYESIHSYCMKEFDLTRKAAFHRIHVARVAWRFPAVLAALEEGRLHVTAVRMLAPKLTTANAEELVAAAAHKTKPEIEQLLAERFPRSEPTPLLLEVLPASQQPATVALGPPSVPEPATGCQRPPGGVEESAPASAPVTLVPSLPPRFPLKVSLRQETHQRIRYAQELLSHQVPSGDVAEVLDLALVELIRSLEKRKFAATDKPRTSRPTKASKGRYVPTEVKRAVWQRDGQQCTFVSETGKRCPARSRLEFDHILEVARGGQSTVENVRLRCRAHNQYTAECRFGMDLMRRKRQQARQAAEDRKRAAPA